ncbi:MAG: DUF3052 domain-containing protein [Betaproteobacteria bacterium]
MTSSAGYSGTPLWQKLGLKPGQRLLLLDAPKDFDQLLVGAPAGVVHITRVSAFDAAILFATTIRAQETNLARALPRFGSGGMLWLAWPKKASGVITDLTDETVRRMGLAAGLVDIKVCAIDETWSALKFVHRHGRTL